MEVCETENIKLKSYFYALRTALAGKWIIDNNSFPPVAFAELLPIAPQEIQDKVLKLQEIKAKQDEKYLHPKEELITDFLQTTIIYNQEKASGLSAGKKINATLEDFFKAEIKR